MLTLSGTHIALLATDGVEHSELMDPRAALEHAGAICRLVAPGRGDVATFRHLEPVDWIAVDLVLDEAREEQFDGLVLPGGVANPDTLRMDPRAVAFVRAFVDAGKPVAAICHAPWLLVEADRVAGRSLTSWPSLRTDIVNAGGAWSDEPVVRDGQLVTSRGPQDLPRFISTVIDALAGSPPAGDALDAQLEDSFPASDPPSITTAPTMPRRR